MPRKATIVLYDGDDFERLSDLRRAVQVAENNAKVASLADGPLRIGDPSDEVIAAGEVKRARRAYSDAVDEAAERAETWVLEAIGHGEFRQIVADHPPRKITETDDGGESREVTHPDDAGWEVDTRTFPAALLTFIDPEDDEIRTVVEPHFDDVDALRRRIKRLSAGELDTLWVAAHSLNTGQVADPKASGFYVGDRKSDET